MVGRNGTEGHNQNAAQGNRPLLSLRMTYELPTKSLLSREFCPPMHSTLGSVCPPALPKPQRIGVAQVNCIRVWYAVLGHGSPVILLHGGLANSNYWGLQISTLALLAFAKQPQPSNQLKIIRPLRLISPDSYCSGSEVNNVRTRRFLSFRAFSRITLADNDDIPLVEIIV
jgi:hypothetical protein